MSDLTHDSAAPPDDSKQPQTLQTSASRISKLNDSLDSAMDAMQHVRRIEVMPVPTTPGMEIPLAQIVPSKTNPRKSFNGPGMDELIASVELHGILQPVLVRPRELTAADVEDWNETLHTIGQGDRDLERAGYELVCGERRYRAAVAAGLFDIPVMLRNLRDDEVLTIQIVENLQREDVSALEEASGYKTLMETMTAQQDGALISDRKTHEEMVAQIAQKIGKSTRYVWARMKLDQLIPQAKQALAEGRIDASHGDELARLSESQQKQVFLELFCEGSSWERQQALEENPGKEPEYKLYSAADIPSVRDLKERLKRDGRELKRAPWKLNKDTLAPACGPCEFNTANQEGSDPKRPMCINTGCYEDKAKRTIDVQVSALRAARHGNDPQKVTSSYRSNDKSVLKESDWIKGAKGSCEFLVDAVKVDGEGVVVGVVTNICVYKACKVHFAGGASLSAADKTRNEAERVRKAANKREQEISNRTLTAFIGTVTKLTPEILRPLTTWYANARHCGADIQKLVSEACGKPVLDVVKKSPVDTPEFAKVVAGIFAARNVGVADWSGPEVGREDFHAVIDSLGGSAKKLRAAVELSSSQKPEKKELTNEQLNSLAPAKKAAPKQFAKKAAKPVAKKAVAKKAAKKPVKKTAKKVGK